MPIDCSSSRGPLQRLSVRHRVALGLVATTAALVVFASTAGAAGTVSAAVETASSSLTWWKAAILGVVEGITEFLPISSTGHLLVASKLLGLPDAEGSAGLDAVNTYVVAIQFGAILAVLGLFWKRFRSMVLGLIGRDDDGRHLLVVLVLAFLPSAVLGAAFDSKIESVLFGPWPIVAAWILGGALILWLEESGRIRSRVVRAVDDVDRVVAITYRQALIIGFAQCVALWPGTSRSLTTIVAALLLGVAMPAAVEFSFLLGFATLSAASLFKLAKDGGTLVETFGVLNPLIGMVFAFVAAVVAIRWLVTYLQRHDLSVFAWYRFAVAAATIGLLASGVI